MKMLICGLAATMLSTAALAQSTPPPPADPMAAPPASTMSSPPATPSAPLTPAAPMATAETGPTLVQKNGKWWNGDRKATKAEIAEYQRTHPQ